MVRDRVAGSHATRACATCLEQLFCAHGAMLFVADAPFTAATPAILAADLASFDGLLGRNCASGPFASRHKVEARARASALLQLLHSLLDVLTRVLTPADMPAHEPRWGVGFRVAAPRAAADANVVAPAVEAPAAAVDVEGLRGSLTQLLAQHRPALTRDMVVRLLSKCKGVASLKGRRTTALVDACDAASARLSVASSGGGTPRPGHEADAEACNHFWSVVDESLQLGRRFSVIRLIDLQQSATRRWT